MIAAAGYHAAMPQRHYVQVVGFQVPGPEHFQHEPLVVLLDRSPGQDWRAVFQLCVEELPEALLRQPPRVAGDEIRVFLAQPPQRRLGADIREFIDRVNRMTFLGEGSSRRGAAP